MSEEKEMPVMLSLRDASKTFGMSYGTLRTMANRGIIPCLHIGRKIYINSDLLRDYLKESHSVNL